VESGFSRISIAVVLATAVACSTPSSPDSEPAPAATTPVPGTASAIVDLTNVERTRAGLAALRTSAALMAAAQIQAEQVAAAGRLEHTLPDARYPRMEDRLDAAGYDWRAAGENLAFGQRTAAAAVETWMATAGHRANILNETFTEIGAGYVIDGNGRPYYVQVFARPAN
jgi:uncharacterized protein YkwD